MRVYIWKVGIWEMSFSFMIHPKLLCLIHLGETTSKRDIKSFGKCILNVGSSKERSVWVELGILAQFQIQELTSLKLKVFEKLFSLWGTFQEWALSLYNASWCFLKNSNKEYVLLFFMFQAVTILHFANV